MTRSPPPQLVNPLPECGTCLHFKSMHNHWGLDRPCNIRDCDCEDYVEMETENDS